VFFSLFIIKIPKSSKRWSTREREREKIGKKWKEKKLKESPQIKRGSQYFERRKAFQLQNIFT
jgi:hypothetical protein